MRLRLRLRDISEIVRSLPLILAGTVAIVLTVMGFFCYVMKWLGFSESLLISTFSIVALVVRGIYKVERR